MTLAPPPPSLDATLLPDHVMVLLDEDTYQNVAASDFLSTRFCRVKPKNADSSVAGQYSTLGLAGTNTLLELFVGAVPGPRRYTAGLVFSFERPGAVPDARRILQERAGIPAYYRLVERADPDGSAGRPWYHLLAPDLGGDSPLLLMLNQVTPEYYARLGARPGPDGELRRRDYLDAVLAGSTPGGSAPTDTDRLLADLTGVTLRLRPAHADRLAGVLTALGYRAQDGVLHGSAFTVTLVVDEAAPEGVTEVAMALTGTPIEPEELRFGPGCRLVLEPTGTARWLFTPVE